LFHIRINSPPKGVVTQNIISVTLIHFGACVMDNIASATAVMMNAIAAPHIITGA
jgi:hypothetical protein